VALTIADRVRETTTTTGTGTITLAGAITNFETFTANLSNSDTTYYSIVDNTNGAFEVGLGTFTSSGTTLARTTVIASSNSNSAVNFGAGTKEVFITIPASKMIVKDASGNVSIDGDVTVSDGTNDFDVASHDGTNGLKLGGTVVTSSAAELNILDGKSFVDEDDMSSNSATGIPSQQSVKAYVDSQVTAQDLDVASDSGTIDIDLDSESFTIAGGEGIDTSATGTTVTIAGEDATTSNKGVASFSSTFFSVSSGAVSLAAAQTGITSLLATDIKIGEDDQTKIDFETADEIHFYASNAEQVYVADGILGPETDSDVDLGSTSVRFKDSYVDSVTVTDNVTIGGNLTVNGTTTTIDTTNTTVKDSLLELNSGAGSNSNDCGIIIQRGSTGNDALFMWDESEDKFALGTTTDNASSTGNLNMTTGTILANVEGNLTGNVTGNASGTAATVTGAAQSNITSLGTLTTLTVDNVIVNGTTIGHTDDTDLITLADGVVTVAGEVDATSLDISGDADIDGTLEADAITVNGTALNTVIADEATALAIALG